MNADGMVLAEGGAIVILEELQHALKRNAKIYGEVLGYSALNEAFDLFGTGTENGAMASNFRRALNNANTDIMNIDYISAHGNGILSYDVAETEAIKEVFGEMAYNIPVTSIKPVTGHSISATGIWQIISSLLTIRNSIIPPTINIQNPAPKCDLNYLRNGFLKKEVQTALINAHGFGGRLTALIISKFVHDETTA
jgi:3-oxoacyl-[acyl-carrier-protein] synthase II